MGADSEIINRGFPRVQRIWEGREEGDLGTLECLFLGAIMAILVWVRRPRDSFVSCCRHFNLHSDEEKPTLA